MGQHFACRSPEFDFMRFFQAVGRAASPGSLRGGGVCLMPLGNERKSLESLFLVFQRFAKASAAFNESQAGNAALTSEGFPLHRFLLANALPLAMSMLGVSLATAGLLLIERFSPASLVPIVYLIPVIVAATRWGTLPAIAAAITSAAAADFFFYPPFYSFRLDDPQAIVDLLLFLLVALVSGDLASRLRSETENLRQRKQELQYLYEFSRRLAACFTVSDLISAIQNYLSGTLRRPTAFFFATSDRNFQPEPVGAVPPAVQQSAALMTRKGGLRADTIRDEATKSVWLLRAVTSDDTTHGVIAVNIGSDSRAVIETNSRRVEAILAEASLTLQRLDIGGAMEEATLRLKDQLLRDAFHGNLSHELRSPLAAIRGSASVLESMPGIRNEDRAYSLVEAVTDEVERLDGFIGNLLNATRVSAGDVRPHLECADPRDIVNAAIRRRSRQLAVHNVKINFDDDLPMINVDSTLVEEACGQLLENAAKYSPSGSTILVNTRAAQGRLILSISDQGVGITPNEQQQLGRRSFRSQRHQASVPGSGLGFWIASTFVKANNGSIEIVSGGQGQGTTASIILPEAQIEEDQSAGSADE
jgi:two-component system, OmpR family, sensor histidine kinase KdpD